jgi:membrane associated rhomboid family serine protease
MIVIPMGTDAPIYHWPYATVGMILLNIAMFFAVPPVSTDPGMDENGDVVEHVLTNFDRYSLTLGDGLHPVQWVTHNFLHYGFLHLAGNLLFLWAFGIVVEGKLGALKFLALYLAIGTLHGASVQALLLRSGLDGHAAGASAVVYGLLAVCMIWAPRNELNCTIILPIGFRVLVFHRELYYTTVALFYVGEQLLGLVFWGSLEGKIMVTELGHLSGATWGTMLAILLLKAKLVDCEEWDVFSLWAKHKQLGREWKARGDRLDRQNQSLKESLRAEAKARKRKDRKADDEEPSPEQRAASAVKRVLGLVEKGDFDAALAAYDKASRALPYWPSQSDLYAIIKAFHAKGAVVDSLRPMRDHCKRYPAASDRMRLKLAQVLIRDRQRPIAALQVLEEIPPGSLPPDLERSRLILARQAEQMRESGVLEVEGED